MRFRSLKKWKILPSSVLKEYKCNERGKMVIRYISDELEISSDDSDA